MSGQLYSGLKRWGVREWVMTALAFAVISSVVLFATRGLAWGSASDVLAVRFGADGDRTRVVIDLERSVQGRVIEGGADGRVILSLSGVTAGRGLEGSGSGLVRAYSVAASGGASRVQLDLGRGSRIERRFLLPPGDGIPHYRYVLDLQATGGPVQVAQPVRTAPEPRRSDRPVIMIDAGHGGRDVGASGQRHHEKELTLAAALALKAELERTGRYRVRMTRDNDAYVDLYRRVAIARQAEADLFISLHADAGSDPALRGASVYTLSEQGAGRAVREFTRDENWHRSLHLPGRDPSVDRILLDMTQRATQNRSAQFARILLNDLERAGRPLLRRSHRDAGLAVLLAPDVPAVLLEMGFITNPEDEQALIDPRVRRQMMKAVVDSIDQYFREPSRPVMTASRGRNG